VLFKEGRTLAAGGHYEDACPLFERSLKLDVGIGTKFNLADCYEHIGKTATARTLFLEVAALAHQSGQGDREQVAPDRAKALDAQVHTISISVKSSTPGLTLRRDGAVLEPEQWGAPQAIDPGVHWIEATAPGKKRWRARVNVPRAGDVTLDVPALKDT